MAVLTVILYIPAAILITFALICISLLLIPLRYKFNGGYEDILWLSFELKSPPFLRIRGNWDNVPGKTLRLWLTVAGISFHLNPQRWGREEEKKEKEKEGKSLSFFAVLRCLERDLPGSACRLLGSLLVMLKPSQVELRGKVGFAEPHLNGWLAGLKYLLA